MIWYCDTINPVKSGLESGAWVDEYNYQNKDKNHDHCEK